MCMYVVRRTSCGRVQVAAHGELECPSSALPYYSVQEHVFLYSYQHFYIDCQHVIQFTISFMSTPPVLQTYQG